jgi:hypothetical protein
VLRTETRLQREEDYHYMHASILERRGYTKTSLLQRIHLAYLQPSTDLCQKQSEARERAIQNDEEGTLPDLTQCQKECLLSQC